MAYVIEGEESSLFNYEGFIHNNHNFNKSIQQQIKNNLLFIKEKFSLETTRLQNDKFIFRETAKGLHISYIERKMHKNVSLIFSIFISTSTKQLKIKAQMHKPSSTFLKVQGHERRKLVTKMLCNRLKNTSHDGKLSINVQSGELRFESPLLLMTHLLLTINLRTFLQLINKIFHQNVRDNIEQMISVLMLTDLSQDVFYAELQARLTDKKLKNAFRYSSLKNVVLNLTSDTMNEEQDINKRLMRQKDSFKKIIQNQIALGQQFKACKFYLEGMFIQKIVITGQQDLNFQERQYIADRLKLPITGHKSSIPNENIFVLNYIKVNKKISQTVIKKIKTGGFTQIYLSQIEYWYVGSTSSQFYYNNSSQKQLTMHKKYIIIKRQDKNLVKLYGKSRVKHQRFILTMIKNGISAFLPKYYLLAQKDNSYQNDLLVDYIRQPNLSEYISKNRHTLSKNTKIYFIIMIGQALRYLKQYQIAHLDLKPSNIMTFYKLNLKLIDFGESYHPKIKYHQPGLSMPYSAPQNYIDSQWFDSKNDVFSLGVIMYQILIGKYPFYMYNEYNREKIYRKGIFEQYWYDAPQQALQFGNPIISSFVYSIMMRCMHPLPSHRPQLEWIVLVLRECLEYL